MRFAAVLLSCCLLGSGFARADVYSPEDLRRGVRAYEALYGDHRVRNPEIDGEAFEFLGYVKAVIDLNDGFAFCLRRGELPHAMARLVESFNRHSQDEYEPRRFVLETLSRTYPCERSQPAVSH